MLLPDGMESVRKEFVVDTRLNLLKKVLDPMETQNLRGREEASINRNLMITRMLNDTTQLETEVLRHDVLATGVVRRCMSFIVVKRFWFGDVAPRLRPGLWNFQKFYSPLRGRQYEYSI